MTWKCPTCGTQNTPEELRCSGCNRTQHPMLTLQSQTTGERLIFRIGTTVGRLLLNRLKDSDVRFVSEAQFSLAYNESKATWSVSPVHGAKNPTHLNGQPLKETVPLESGQVLSIGENRHKVTVSIGE